MANLPARRERTGEGPSLMYRTLHVTCMHSKISYGQVRSQNDKNYIDLSKVFDFQGTVGKFDRTGCMQECHVQSTPAAVSPGVSLQFRQPLLCHIPVLQELGVVLPRQEGDQSRVLLALLPSLLWEQVEELRT